MTKGDRVRCTKDDSLGVGVVQEIKVSEMAGGALVRVDWPAGDCQTIEAPDALQVVSVATGGDCNWMRSAS